MGKREDLVKAMNAITAAVPDGASLSAEQQTHRSTSFLADDQGLDGDIGRLQGSIEAQRELRRDRQDPRHEADNREDDPKRGFKSASASSRSA
jgi:hypothetical protein